MLTLKAKRASFTLLGFRPRNPPPAPHLHPWEEDLGAATPGRDCSEAPATERLYAPCAPLLVSLGTCKRARPARRRFLASCQLMLERDGKTEVVAESRRRYVFRRTPLLSRSGKEKGGVGGTRNLPAHVTSISFALRSGALTTQ